jgi:small-conductance mechanosensitive channel
MIHEPIPLDTDVNEMLRQFKNEDLENERKEVLRLSSELIAVTTELGNLKEENSRLKVTNQTLLESLNTINKLV